MVPKMLLLARSVCVVFAAGRLLSLVCSERIWIALSRFCRGGGPENLIPSDKSVDLIRYQQTTDTSHRLIVSLCFFIIVSSGIKKQTHHHIITITMSLSSAQNNASLLTAAKITVAYTTLYSMTMLNQVVQKKRLLTKYGKSFDRYSSTEMRDADRLTGNFMEWSLIFLGPLWSLAAMEALSATSILMAWTYVGLRVLYLGLSIQYGVNEQGLNKPLWLSTFPSYICLSYILFASIGAVMK